MGKRTVVVTLEEGLAEVVKCKTKVEAIESSSDESDVTRQSYVRSSL